MLATKDIGTAGWEGPGISRGCRARVGAFERRKQAGVRSRPAELADADQRALASASPPYPVGSAFQWKGSGWASGPVAPISWSGPRMWAVMSESGLDGMEHAYPGALDSQSPTPTDFSVIVADNHRFRVRSSDYRAPEHPSRQASATVCAMVLACNHVCMQAYLLL